MYEHDSLCDFRDVEGAVAHLTDLRSSLGPPLGAQTPRNTQTPHEKYLLKLAQECSATAEELVKKLHTLKVDGPHKKRQAIKRTVKALWEKKEIQALHKRLEGYKDALDTRILVDLGSVAYLVVDSALKHLRPSILSL